MDFTFIEERINQTFEGKIENSYSDDSIYSFDYQHPSLKESIHFRIFKNQENTYIHFALPFVKKDPKRPLLIASKIVYFVENELKQLYQKDHDLRIQLILGTHHINIDPMTLEDIEGYKNDIHLTKLLKERLEYKGFVLWLTIFGVIINIIAIAANGYTFFSSIDTAEKILSLFLVFFNSACLFVVIFTPAFYFLPEIIKDILYIKKEKSY